MCTNGNIVDDVLGLSTFLVSSYVQKNVAAERDEYQIQI